MKILSIRIKNLASLSGEHFIDFESEPLASAGLIAIIGKTGAGKSTILDAMCLALFNRIPRLKDSDGKLVDVDGTELLTNSPLTVLRRGTGHGFAELSFIAQDQKTYLARWEIKRARENPNGKLQSVQRSLKCLSDGIIVADKAKAVETAIQKITQLSFEQFTRAVLLAQSEVTAFLKARDNERGELLQYLTNSDIFEKIGQLAYEKTKQIANQRKELENLLGHIEILSDEDVTRYSEELKQSNVQLQLLETEKQQLNKQHQWFEQQHKFELELQSRQAYLTEQQLQFDQRADQRQQLVQLEVFSSIRPSLLQQKKTEAELSYLQPQIQNSEQQFNTIRVAFDADKLAFQTIDDQLKTQQRFEQDHQKVLEQIRVRIQERDFILQQFNKTKTNLIALQEKQQPLQREHQQLKLEIEQLTSQYQRSTESLLSTQQFQSLDPNLPTHVNQLQRFLQRYQQFEQQHGDMSVAIESLKTKQQQLQVSQTQDGLDETITQNINLKQQQRDNHIQQLHQLNVIQNHLQHYFQVQIEQEKNQTQHNELQQDAERLQHQLQLTEQQYLNQKQEREQLQRLLQQQRLLHSENIEKLREQLINDEPCLVCGSTEHPYAHNHVIFSRELVDLQQQQEQHAIHVEKEYFKTWQQSQQYCIKNTASLEINIQQKTELIFKFQYIEQQLSTLLKQIDLSINLSDTQEIIEQTITCTIHQHQRENESIDQTLIHLKNVQEQQKQLKQYIHEVNHQLSSVQQCEQNIQDILSCLNTEQHEKWKKQTLETASQFNQQLQDRIEQLKQTESFHLQLNSKNQYLNQLEQRIEFSNEQIKSTEIQKDEYAKKGKENTESAIQLIFDIAKEKVEKPHDWLIQFDQQRQQLQQQFNIIRSNYDQVRQNFENQQRQLDQLQIQNQQLKAQLQNILSEVQNWLTRHPEFDCAQLNQLLNIQTEQAQQIHISVQQVERALNDAQTAFKTIQEQYQQHLLLQPAIERIPLQTQLSEVQEHMLQIQEVRDSVQLKLKLHQNNLDKQKKFYDQIQQIQQEEHRWNKISGLMGDANGKKFRDYAQQYNLDILIEYANQQLAILSQRYTLKRLDHSLSLAIVDHDMDGETRSVSSLSGGESFLTALALSLAIANMASGSMKIESLFIDEGFGTLDASSLHLVMNALDQLQSQGRKVVLISHIQEMHERIPVQIQVKAIGAGASTIEIAS